MRSAGRIAVSTLILALGIAVGIALSVGSRAQDAEEPASRRRPSGEVVRDAGYAALRAVARIRLDPDHERTVGLAGLRLHALACGGCTHQVGPHKDAVRELVTRLHEFQDESGRLGGEDGPHADWNHHWATKGLVAMYGLSGTRRQREPVERAVKFVLRRGEAFPLTRPLDEWEPQDLERVVLLHAATRCEIEHGWEPSEDQLGVARTWVEDLARVPPDRFERHDVCRLAAAVVLLRLYDDGKRTRRRIAPAGPVVFAAAEQLDCAPEKWRTEGVDAALWTAVQRATWNAGADGWETWRTRVLPVLRGPAQESDARPWFVRYDDGGRLRDPERTTRLTCLLLQVVFRSPARGRFAR